MANASDIKLSYDTISGVAGVLTSAETTLVQDFQGFQNRVDGLLTQDGGMWLNSTSPAIRTQYDQFSASALQMCTSIASFADMFTKFVMNMTSMDQKMAYSISHPPPTTS